MSAAVERAGSRPRCIPHSRMRELDYFTGLWTTTGTVRDAPFGITKPLRARVSTWSVEDGFWLQVRIQEQPATGNPAPLSARQVWGYDMTSHRYLCCHVDNQGNHAQASSAPSDSNALVFEGWIAHAGARLPLRQTFKRLGPARYVRVDEMKLGARWSIVAEADVRRQKRNGFPRVYTGQLSR